MGEIEFSRTVFRLSSMAVRIKPTEFIKLLRIFLLACLRKLISSEDCFCDRSALCIVLSGGGLVLCHECVLLNPHHRCKLIIVHFGYSFTHTRGWRSLLSFCFFQTNRVLQI